MRPETERALRGNDPSFSTDLSTAIVNNAHPVILNIALDAPLRKTFDYRLPDGHTGPPPRPGVRIRVPFSGRQLVGVLVDTSPISALPSGKLKAALAILDTEPVFDVMTFELLRFAAEYYHHPVGEVIAAALPAALRDGGATDDSCEFWTLTAAGRVELDTPTSRRAPRQRALLAWLAARGSATRADIAREFKTVLLPALRAQGWVSAQRVLPFDSVLAVHASEVTLTAAQVSVVESITASVGRFAAHLLYGVTGSGKTEIYLRSIAAAIAGGGQALVLVPEIGLTPQLVERFRRRFSTGIAVLHSALSNRERRDAWRAAHGGRARIIIGTRSAVFASLPDLRMIVVDEEHDASYKQQEGFRYSARDLAVWRAQRAAIPIVLGSATPSLETLDNAAQGRYSKLVLPLRPGAARAPQLNLVDMRRHASHQGLSQPALDAIDRHLKSGGQVIVFVNRRGYAPALFCTGCGWVAPCAHCDARMTLHRAAARLRCHHCGASAPEPSICGQCAQPLRAVGQGTERVEETLGKVFPAAPLARLDRDTAAGRGAMETVLNRVHSGDARLLVGTQMLTKGHDFPDVSLVVILDADQGLFASDFRATERLAQTITQVAGRAGRAARPGEVLIQTAFPEHPLLTRLIAAGYDGFAAAALVERRDAQWPPFARLAMLRAEARDSTALDEFLGRAAGLGRDLPEAQEGVAILGPASALMARRADHFRAHVLIETRLRSTLQRFLARWIPEVDALSGPKGLRWSIDVDPLEID